ncbi:MAG: ATP synthase F0 subunit B [Deltaproteobacteria bacterium]|nr:ATP synthase F0 subunit B [Deltaproteobacteria bacterium]
MRNFLDAGKGFKVILFTLFLYFIFIAVSFASSDGGRGEAIGWVATDTYRVMNFAVLAIALFYIVKKPVSTALSARINGIKEQLTDLEAKKEKALQQVANYEKKFANLDKEAENIIDGYVKQGEEAKARILKQADEAAKKMEEAAKKNINYQFAQAKKELQKEIVSESLLKAKELIKNKINPDDHNRLIDEYLNKVVA